MSERVGQFKHLDESYPIVLKDFEGVYISVPFASFVEAALDSNYGLHRLLSEIVIQLGSMNEEEMKEFDVQDRVELVEQIKTFLDEGGK